MQSSGSNAGQEAERLKRVPSVAAPDHHPRRGTRGQRQRQILLSHPGQIGMTEIDLDRRCPLRRRAQALSARPLDRTPQGALRAMESTR
ncbi:MAG: hypothetical protein ABI339_03470 [Solirubrobacteraceae bacterium]